MGPALSLWHGTPAGAQTIVGVSVVKGGALPLNHEAGGIWEAQTFSMQVRLPTLSCVELLFPGSWGPVHLHSASPSGT